MRVRFQVMFLLIIVAVSVISVWRFFNMIHSFRYYGLSYYTMYDV